MVRKEGQNCRNLRFKIRPTPEQERKLDETLESCRSIWNHLLSLQVDLYERSGLSVKRSDLEKHLKNLDYPIHSSVRLDVFQRLCFAYDKFFNDLKKGRLKKPNLKKGCSSREKMSHVETILQDSSNTMESSLKPIPISRAEKISVVSDTNSMVMDGGSKKISYIYPR
ncbi:helix-turn-helix domain-containing protein [Methanohalobium evestigatum]|uniref:helix-turn-helix domain-containing protein n=1 Tax=Methanohalobium evestigatum TaxID=2322 RepID=UPI0006778966|nr:helix-turn-helix domain-containing protein [Methanohalobium evestigatum]